MTEHKGWIFSEEILRHSSYYQEIFESGRQQGLIEARRKTRFYIRELIANRFPNDDVRPVLDHIHDDDRLKELFQIALKAQTATEVRTAIAATEDYCTS